ncbi:MAG: DNA-directed RNA polymerase subunit omega [Bacteroidales bacterium]|nr:DNA-directed RNA polymerase subunit omega [Bacteroidales bacterium]
MDYKKLYAPFTTVTYDIDKLEDLTGNIYLTTIIAAKRANQIAAEIKNELYQKLEEFQTTTDTLEETFENPEQIELVRYYEKLPKPTMIAVQELIDNKLVYTFTDENK